MEVPELLSVLGVIVIMNAPVAFVIFIFRQGRKK